MATTYSFLLEGKNPTGQTFQLIADILNRGWTYDVVRGAIFHCFHNHLHFPFRKFSQKVEGNLLQQSVRYYHKELILLSGPQEEAHNVDTGNITSSEYQFYVEPRASYTIDDLLAYFKKNVLYNQTLYTDNRLKGFFRHEVERFGLDVTMFMIEYLIRMGRSDRTNFDLKRFDDYYLEGHKFLEENKNSVAYAGGAGYVLRERMLLD